MSALGPKLVLGVCLATGSTTLLDQAILTVAVPALRADLGAGRSDLQWILAAYSLTFGLALVPAGRLGGSVGRGRLLVGGLALFSSASLVGAFASAPWVLVTARLRQGIGAGTANPQVIGLLLAVAGEHLGWRLVVAVNLPFGIATGLLALRLVEPRAPGGRRRVPLDGPGLLLLTVPTLGALLPVVGVGTGSARGIAGWAVLGGVVVLALTGWEKRLARRGGDPILRPALARSRGFRLGTLVAMGWFGAVLGSGAAVVLFLQEGLGLGPLPAGLLLPPRRPPRRSSAEPAAGRPSPGREVHGGTGRGLGRTRGARGRGGRSSAAGSVRIPGPAPGSEPAPP